MGTRADFYIGRGKHAEWLGSIAYDGYPEGIAESVINSGNEKEWRTALTVFLEGREDATFPEDGWPWPWEDSHTTDYAYAFDGERVWICGLQKTWFPVNDKEPFESEKIVNKQAAIFPDMTSKQKVTLGKRSGLLFLA